MIRVVMGHKDSRDGLAFAVGLDEVVDGVGVRDQEGGVDEHALGGANDEGCDA